MIKVLLKSAELKNGMNEAFKNLNGLDLVVYLAADGCQVLGSEVIDNVKYTRFYLEHIDDSHLPFIDSYRQNFKFSGIELGWVKDVTEEELDTLVPDTFKDANSRTFREYFATSKEVDSVKYYATYSYPNGYNREDFPNETDFWQFYDYFGADRITLNI